MVYLALMCLLPLEQLCSYPPQAGENIKNTKLETSHSSNEQFSK